MGLVQQMYILVEISIMTQTATIYYFGMELRFRYQHLVIMCIFQPQFMH